MFREAQYLLRFRKWGRKLTGLDCGEKTPQLSVVSQRSSGMGDLSGSPGYRVQALEVMIDAM